MATQTLEIRAPRNHDRPLYDLLWAPVAFQSVCVAHESKLFSLLDERPRSVAEVASALGIDARPAEMSHTNDGHPDR